MNLYRPLIFLIGAQVIYGVPSRDFKLWPNLAPGEQKDEVEPESIKPPKDENDVQKYQLYSEVTDIYLFDSKGYEKSMTFDHGLIRKLKINKP